jgi:hypothetical protein
MLLIILFIKLHCIHSIKVWFHQQKSTFTDNYLTVFQIEIFGETRLKLVTHNAILFNSTVFILSQCNAIKCFFAVVFSLDCVSSALLIILCSIFNTLCS